MSVRPSALLTATAAVALAASVATAAQASARSVSPQRTAAAPGVSTSASGTAVDLSCGVRSEFFAPDGTHHALEVLNGGSTRDTSYARWAFVPRALSYYKTVVTTTTTTDYYYAITSDGRLYRVGETTGLASGGMSMAYVVVGSGWSTTKDIAVRDDRFYYVTSTGELRRRAIHVGGLLSGSILLRSGLTSTIALSNDATVRWGGASNLEAPVTDEILAITREGALQRHEVRVSGLGVPLSTVTTLKTAGWNRFNSVDAARCSDDSVSLVGRDYTTKTLLAYSDVDAYDYSGTDLVFRGSPGSLLYPTYGA